MENEEKQLIETVDEDGNVINFELYDIVEVDGQEYALLLPTEADEDDEEDGEIVLMRLTKDGEDYLFETIEDDEEFNKVEAYIQSLEDEEEIAKQVAKLFIIDLYSIDYKINKYEVTSTQYFYSDKRDMHRAKLLDTMYKSVEDNSYGDRKQELPIVKKVEMISVDNNSYEYNDTVDNNAYYLTMSITYDKNLGYPSEVDLVLIHNGDKLEVAEMKTE